MGVSNKTIIPLALVGYEMILANSALRASLAFYLLVSNARSWNNRYLSSEIDVNASEFSTARTTDV